METMGRVSTLHLYAVCRKSRKPLARYLLRKSAKILGIFRETLGTLLKPACGSLKRDLSERV